MIVARALGIVVVVLLGGCAAVQVPQDVEAHIVALERLRAQAQLRGDWETIRRLNAPDFDEIAGDGGLRTGAENNEAMRAGILKFDAVDYSGLRVRVHGDVAVVTGVARRSGSFRGTPFEQHLRFSRIYVRAEGTWRAVFAQNTRIEPRGGR